MGIVKGVASLFGVKELKITGNMKVKTVKKDFKEAFGATLRIYNGARFADDNATIASIRKGSAKETKSGDFWVGGKTKVGEFEKKVEQAFGVKIQVANKDDSALSNNNLTLSEAGKE